MFRWHCFSGST